MELRNQKSKETIRKEHEWLNKLIIKNVRLKQQNGKTM